MSKIKKVVKGTKDGAKQLGDDIKKKQITTKDIEFVELEKQFEEKDKLLAHMVKDLNSLPSGSVYVKGNKEFADSLSKMVTKDSLSSTHCIQLLDALTEIEKSKEQLDRQTKDSSSAPALLYEQFKEVKERIHQRLEREYKMHTYNEKLEKMKNKSDPKYLETQVKRDAATRAFQELNNELKRDITALLRDTNIFFDNFSLTFIKCQHLFCSSIFHSFDTLAQKVEISRAVTPVVVQSITPKDQSVAYDKNVAKAPTPITTTVVTTTYLTPNYTSPAPPSPRLSTGQQSPGTQSPGTQSPGTQSPGTQSPGTQSPRTQSPGKQSPCPSPRGLPVMSGLSHSQSVPVPPPKLPVVTPPKLQVRGMWDFNTQNPNELPFRAGDIITVLAQGSDWWTGELNGKTGLIPRNYVSPL